MQAARSYNPAGMRGTCSIMRATNWFGRMHPDDVPRVAAAYRALFETGAGFDVEYRIQRKDGAWLWLHDRATEIYEADGVRSTTGLSTDITERRRVEQALGESEARHRHTPRVVTTGYQGLD